MKWFPVAANGRAFARAAVGRSIYYYGSLLCHLYVTRAPNAIALTPTTDD